jgi:hypothetical protein
MTAVARSDERHHAAMGADFGGESHMVARGDPLDRQCIGGRNVDLALGDGRSTSRSRAVSLTVRDENACAAAGPHSAAMRL